MFLGYQGQKIVLTAQNAAELENVKEIQFDNIKETARQVVLFNGEYLFADAISAEEYNAEIKKKRQARFEAQTDKMLLEKLETASDVQSLLTAVSEWKNVKDGIRAALPYRQ